MSNTLFTAVKSAWIWLLSFFSPDTFSTSYSTMVSPVIFPKPYYCKSGPLPPSRPGSLSWKVLLGITHISLHVCSAPLGCPSFYRFLVPLLCSASPKNLPLFVTIYNIDHFSVTLYCLVNHMRARINLNLSLSPSPLSPGYVPNC